MPVGTTVLTDLWNPQRWIQGAEEQMRNLPSVINSGVAVRSALFDDFASNQAQTINVPFFADITDTDDEIQVPDTAANTLAKIIGALQIAIMQNRQFRIDVAALAAQVSGADPVGQALKSIAKIRLKNRQKNLIALLRGAFGSLTGNNGCLAANINDISQANGLTAGSANLIKRTTLTATLTLLGELADDVLEGGIMITHPVIREAFAGQNTSIQLLPADTPLIVQKFGGLQIYASNALVSAAPQGGFIYETYIMKPGVVAWGEKPQVGDVIDVASLQYYANKQKNNAELYDRTRFLLHLNGLKWVGTPAGDSPTNAELQAAANWTNQFQSADRNGIVCIKSNG